MHVTIDDPDINVISAGEVSPFDPDEFPYTCLIYKKGDEVFGARINECTEEGAQYKFEQIVQTRQIPKAAYQPRYYSTVLTEAKNTSHHGVAEDILQEAFIGEALRTKPNDHLAGYHGCVVKDGRITGVCFTKYEDTLEHKLNPGQLNKRGSADRNKNLDYDWVDKVIAGVEDALKHLHYMGFVHNSLNPANIMFDYDGNPKLIDFGSCRLIGEKLVDVRRTWEWFDGKVSTALRSNDFDVLKEIEAWMKGREDDFKFNQM